MSPKPTVQLPDLPGDWYQSVTGVPVSGAPFGAAGGILDGLAAPREWSLADSGFSLIMSPEEIKMIDFSGTARRSRRHGRAGPAMARRRSLIPGRPNWAAKAFSPG